MSAAPAYGWYGDDFTGATDTLATLSLAGLRAMLFLGVPHAQRLQGLALDAIGIAGATRAMGPQAMADALEPAGAFLAAAGCRVLHYKVCSTFDSAPQVGNIAQAIRVLRRHVANPLVAILGGQPSLQRYCAFSNLFAAAGAGGAIARIDRHPTMRDHPSTPMREADLRRHFAALGMEDVAAVHLPTYAAGGAALHDAVRSHITACAPAVLFDVTEAAQLQLVGNLLRRHAERAPLLAVGPSSVAQAWMSGHGGAPQALCPSTDPLFVFVGSLSPVTQRQIDAAHAYRHVALCTADLQQPQDGEGARAVLQALGEGRHVLACTPRDTGASGLSTCAMADASARFVQHILRARVAAGRPLRRIGIAGGDTSSFVTQSLGLWGLSYAASLGQGVTVSRGHSDEPALDGIELMLKGGQMGAPEVFAQLL